MPVAKSYLFYVNTHLSALQIVVEDYENTREPTNHHSHYILSEGRSFCADILPYIETDTTDEKWLKTWQHLEEAASTELSNIETSELTEGEVIRDFLKQIPDDSVRSEEHTSELQSRGHLVCRLLLE